MQLHTHIIFAVVLVSRLQFMVGTHIIHEEAQACIPRVSQRTFSPRAFGLSTLAGPHAADRREPGRHVGTVLSDHFHKRGAKCLIHQATTTCPP
jgi:hypothetical protein